MKQRLRDLADLIELKVPLESAIAKLRTYPFDYTGDPYIIQPRHIIHAIERFLSGEISEDQLVAWANELEFRDDVKSMGSSPQEETLITQSLVWLANRELTPQTLTETANSILSQLRPTK